MARVRKTVASAAVAAALVAAASSCRTDPIDLADNGGRPTTAAATPSASPATATPTEPTPATPTAPTTTAAEVTPPASAPATSTAPAGPIPAPATTQAQAPAPVPPPTTTRPATTPSASPRPVPAPSTPAAPAAGTRQDEVVRLTNVERQAAGCGPLAVDASLSAAAQAHSADMAANNYFSHSGLDGTSPGDRARAAGFPSSYVGENIAAGSTTPAAAIALWMGSSGHRANILNCAYTHIGVGYAEGGSYRYYWTQVFGTR
ncbi:serine protease [Frankia sp. CcI49]|uniref:CAP domain-containing protein n=1 Tax=Frankia sp. CcI49 TaxID=1745382 RepID=UPI0009761211|nr:CAP domain-containing protein [Frankia sp. CcI49]ONH56145.1 serine protease [Frankia sp. CcI49]